MDFTVEQQAEVDKIVQSRLAREKEKFADYDSIKTKVNDLETYKAQAEYNLQVKVKEALEQKETELKTTYEDQIKALKAEQTRDKFLATTEIKLPSAYKNMIKASDNEAEIKASYEEVVKSWKEEMKALGLDKTGKDIGAPGSPAGASTTKKFSEMTYQEKEELAKQDIELYRKLKAQN